MALKGIFVIAAACLLARMEAASSLNCLSSYWKSVQECLGGNLIEINTDKCSTVDGNNQCEVKSTGKITTRPRTQFKIEEPDKTNKPGLYCIQFTDKDDSNKTYALKAINGNSLAFEEGGCHASISNDFLFKEHVRTIYPRQYTYSSSQYSGKCLTGKCDGGLSLISYNKRKCLFRKLSV